MKLDEIFIVFPKMEKNQKKVKKIQISMLACASSFSFFFGFSMVLYTNAPKPRVTGVHP